MTAFAADGTWEMPPGSGPCRTWPVTDLCGCMPPDPQAWNAEQRQAVEIATELLWRATAGRFGVCRETVRPCRQECRPGGCEPVPPRPGTRWHDAGRCNTGCGCRPVSEFVLPGPVLWAPTDNPAEVSYDLAVWIDGVELPTTAWRLYDNNRLIRADGGWWPHCQDLALDLTEPGTWGVVYWRGRLVPPGGRSAVGQVACEMWHACTGATGCPVSPRVVSRQREGITEAMVDIQTLLDRGLTGIPDVDTWLVAVNPHGLKQPPAVYSPDMTTVFGEHTTGFW